MSTKILSFSELGSRKFIEKEPTLGKAIAPSSL